MIDLLMQMVLGPFTDLFSNQEKERENALFLLALEVAISVMAVLCSGWKREFLIFAFIFLWILAGIVAIGPV